MTDDLVPETQNHALTQAGKIANGIAAKGVLTDYQSRKAKNTLLRQANDLALFAEYLSAVGLSGVGDYFQDIQAWHGVTWGLVEGFVRWQLNQGYSVSSVNIHLSTVKTYSRLAMKAGILDPSEYAQIRAVQGYGYKEAKRIDEQRNINDQATRKGAKKSEAVRLTIDQAAALKTQPDTPQGRRDALLMCLLLDHGLRVGEIAILVVSDFDLSAGLLRFYRPKVGKTQVHRLTPNALRAAQAYFKSDAPDSGCIWMASRMGRDALTTQGISERGLTKRVCTLGQGLEINGLSAHDCRHYWATQAARNKTPLDRLQDAGGWNSPAMPLRYIEAQAVANDGVLLK